MNKATAGVRARHGRLTATTGGILEWDWRRILCAVCVAAGAAACAGCADLVFFLNYAVPPASCSFGVRTSDASCHTIATTGGCETYAWSSTNFACTGQTCKVVEVPGSLIPSYERCGDERLIVAAASSADTRATKAFERPTDRVPAGAFLRSAADDAVFPPERRVAEASALAAPTIVEYGLPKADMQPGPIVATTKRILFSAMASCTSAACANGVYRIDSTGLVTLVQQSCNNVDGCRHTGLTAMSTDGYCAAVTHRQSGGNLVTDGVICNVSGTQRDHPVRPYDVILAGLAQGADGKVWYVDAWNGGIGRIDDGTNATQVVYLDPAIDWQLASLGSASDGMWFTAPKSGQIGHVSTTGIVLKTPPTPDAQPAGIVVGPDGNVWFTELKGNKIARLKPNGTITEFALPTADAGPLGITVGPDGALWFTEYNAGKIGRISRFGDITEFAVPTPNAQPAGIVTGPDGALWFTELGASKIGKLTLPDASALPTVVEFYNAPLDNYFITANAAEQNAIDSGSAGPGWSRTGSTFYSGGSSSVCRFYGSISPGPNSHFYTADPNECATLKQIQATTPATEKRWNYESLDFNTTPATNGTCPAGLTPVYRAYNNGFTRGVDSNHRITSSAGAIAEVVQRGWVSEGTVMCAP